MSPPLLPMAQIAAPYALLCAYAEDLFDRLIQVKARGQLNPAFPEGYPPAVDWNIIGYLTGVDALPRGIPVSAVDSFGQDVYYGLLLSSKTAPTNSAIVIRGTEDMTEWLEDAEFVPQSIQGGAVVETVFYALYKRMNFADVSGNPANGLLAGLSEALKNAGATSTVVTGHSLGAALATHLALDLALTPLTNVQVSTYLFASPRVGDAAYASLFNSQVSTCKGYSFDLDLVPKLPSIGYTPLPSIQNFSPAEAQARIKISILNPAAAHHAVCYAAMLDYNAVPKWQGLPFISSTCCSCVLGPNP
jgi:hypothetical protein